MKIWLQLLLAIPALLLSAGAFLRHVPGEWSRGALLAWSIVAFSFLVGQAASAIPGWAAAAAILLGFIALALGGTAGLGFAAMLFGALAGLSLAGLLAVPAMLCFAIAAATTAAAIRGALLP